MSMIVTVTPLTVSFAVFASVTDWRAFETSPPASRDRLRVALRAGSQTIFAAVLHLDARYSVPGETILLPSPRQPAERTITPATEAVKPHTHVGTGEVEQITPLVTPGEHL